MSSTQPLSKREQPVITALPSQHPAGRNRLPPKRTSSHYPAEANRLLPMRLHHTIRVETSRLSLQETPLRVQPRLHLKPSEDLHACKFCTVPNLEIQREVCRNKGSEQSEHVHRRVSVQVLHIVGLCVPRFGKRHRNNVQNRHTPLEERHMVILHTRRPPKNRNGSG